MNTSDVILLEDGVERHPEAREVQNGAISRKMKDRFGSFAKNFENVGKRRVRTHGGIDLGNQLTFEVDWPRIERVLCNVMKGVFYISQKSQLPQRFAISVRDVCSVNSDWLEKTVGYMRNWQSFGDTVFCYRYVRSSKEPIEKFTCLMQFYEHHCFIGEAINPKLLGEDGDLFVPANQNSTVVVPRWSADR